MLTAGQTWPTMAADLRRMVPRWHFEMLADHARNTALIRAINDVVQPGHLVLDVGTGAGLTALAAARRGAHVITCEVNPVVAELARQVAAVNGYSQKIEVVAAPSTAVRVGTHLPRPADVLVAEVFDADLFGEGAVPTIDDARRRLLAPDGRILPSSATVWCQLVDSADLYGLNRVGQVHGFDLTPFNQAATDGVMFAPLTNYPWTPLTAPVELVDVDFTHPAAAASGVCTVDVDQPGTLHAVVVWFELQLGRWWLQNKPGLRSHWKQAVYVVDARRVAAGDVLSVVWSHDTKRLTVHIGGPT